MRDVKINRVFYPLITFTDVRAGKQVLEREDLRQNAANGIRELLDKNNFTGVHLDFEYIPPSYSQKLAEFLKHLRKVIGNKKITMAVFPSVDFPEKLSGFHDLKAISPHLDEIVIMCYDLHRSDTGPGPITDPEWTRKNIKAALKFIKPEKIWLGVPSYGYIWTDGKKGVPISAKKGIEMARTRGYIRHASGNVMVQYSEEGKEYTIFFSDRHMRSILEKIAGEFNLAGTALWRIGLEE
ncbi:MAG: glycosyl hydrolase family 18 protein [Spirochaetes bacterium]|nr:glycosyl hydrolase family 18 protein [Spirochaetota bacterium]